MATNINWGKLKIQGRVKDVGIPWSEEESRAIYELKIPFEYVRKGILTIEDYKKAKQEGIKLSKKKEDLIEEAKELEIDFTPEVEVEVLEKEIKEKKLLNNKKKKNVKKTKKQTIKKTSRK